MIIGYARVSTDGQTLDAQQSALLAVGADKVFAEKVSGAVTERKALARAFSALGHGDVLLVTRLDRLARSTYSTALMLLERLVQVSNVGGCLGRHHHPAWPLDADDPRRPCRV
jgi:DNA invertase Pin-like site-specific DNA recombinase